MTNYRYSILGYESSTISKKSTPKTPDASGDRLKAADFDKAQSADQLHRETEAKDAESR